MAYIRYESDPFCVHIYIGCIYDLGMVAYILFIWVTNPDFGLASTILGR